MVVERFFVKEGIRKAQIEEFLQDRFEKAGYSHIDIQRTPLGTRLIVYAERPGLVIGKSGRKIQEITDEIKEKFQLENPLLDVIEVNNPYLDAQIVATKIAKSIERGGFYKKIANFFLQRVTEEGAIGIEIRTAGKLSGERGRFQVFKAGYIKHAGYYADHVVDKGYCKATLKLGSVGVQVRILKELPEDRNLKIKEMVEPDEKKRAEKSKN